MPNPENLTPVNSETASALGKLGGRPKGAVSISTHLKRLMEAQLKGQKNPITNEKQDMTVSERIATKLMMKAMNGDLRATELAMDRLEGKAVQIVENLNREVPVTEDEKMTLLADIARRKGLTVEDLIEKEGLSI